MTLAGLSGSGKSLICEELKRDFVDLNQDDKFDILSFEFEMHSKDQVARNLSGKIGKSTKYLYSGEDNFVTDEEFETIKTVATDIRKYPIYYVDDFGSVDEIRDTVLAFVEQQDLLSRDRGLVVTIDHVLLTKGRQDEAEKKVIDTLSHMCVELKKRLTSMGLRIIIILLSQLNRNIETPDRVTNPMLHYPTKNDIFGASSLFQASDYVLVTHKPSVVDGIGEYYGPPRASFPKGLPVYVPEDEERSMVYWHLLKERFGKPKVLMMVDYFEKSSCKEYNL